MSWLFLMFAIVCDVLGTAALERANQRRGVGYFAVGVVCFGLALWTFAGALHGIPTAVADAIFFAGATALVTVVGLRWLGEQLTVRKGLGLLLIVCGVATLRLGGVS